MVLFFHYYSIESLFQAIANSAEVLRAFRVPNPRGYGKPRASGMPAATVSIIPRNDSNAIANIFGRGSSTSQDRDSMAFKLKTAGEIMEAVHDDLSDIRTDLSVLMDRVMKDMMAIDHVIHRLLKE